MDANRILLLLCILGLQLVQFGIVSAQLTIDVQPADQLNQVPGTNVQFSVTVSGGAGSPVFTWTMNGNTLTDGTKYGGLGTATLTVMNVQEADEGNYGVVVIDGCASFFAISTTGELTLLDLPVITVQPVDQTDIPQGNDVPFTVTATGSPPLTYQWQLNEVVIVADATKYSGIDSASLLVMDVGESDNGNYRCVVSNGAGSDISDSASLTVLDPPVITAQPTSYLNQIPGINITFSVMATGGGLSYQWQKDGVVLTDGVKYSGATTATLTVMDIQYPDDEGLFNVIIENTADSETSDAATLDIVEPITIVTQPEDVTIAAGSNATFTVLVSGDSPSYQWQKDEEAINDLADTYSGTNTATLTVLSVADPADEGNYTVVVSNAATTPGVTSDPAATLTVGVRGSSLPTSSVNILTTLLIVALALTHLVT